MTRSLEAVEHKKFVHPIARVNSNSHQSRKGAPVRNGILIYIFTYPANFYTITKIIAYGKNPYAIIM